VSAAAIRALVCGYAASVWPRKLIVILQAFADDSASDAGDKRMFLAAYITTADLWISFSQLWDRELKRPPSIDYFKMVEANGLRGQFAGWSRPDRDAKVLALAQIIHFFKPWFVYGSVSREEYGRILAPVATAGLKTPYFACFWCLIRTTARYHQMFGHDVPPVDFVFDEQGGLGDDAALMYRWLKESEPPEIQKLLGSTPIFRDDKLMLPLQAADMLAWHIRRQHEGAISTDDPIFKLLTEDGCGAHLDEATLKGLARKMKFVPGRSRVQTKPEWRKTRDWYRKQNAVGGPPPLTNWVWMYYIAVRAWIERAIHRWRYPRR
jgi:hypothetical protein